MKLEGTAQMLHPEWSAAQTLLSCSRYLVILAGSRDGEIIDPE